VNKTTVYIKKLGKNGIVMCRPWRPYAARCGLVRRSLVYSSWSWKYIRTFSFSSLLHSAATF